MSMAIWRQISPTLAMSIFFFFQAEDGIRDVAVTGVRRVLFRSVGHRRPALHSILDQLSRSRSDFIRAAVDLQGFSSDIDNKGAAPFFFLLVVRTHANPDWLVRRPFEFAVALRGSLRDLVLGTGANRFGGESCSAGWLAHPSWRRGVHLSSRWVEDRQLALLGQRTRFTFRAFRFWNQNRISSRRDLGPLAFSALRLAPHVSPFGPHGSGLADSVVSNFSSPNAFS